MNIDTLDFSIDTNSYLLDFCDTFFLNNLILGKTCFNAASGTSVDVMLTNRPRSFQKTAIIETGLSNRYKLIVSFFRTHFARLPPKKSEYRNYKKIDSKSFLYELDQELLKGEMYKDHSDKFSAFTNVFRNVLDKYSPLKTKTISGNHAPFMTKNLSKAIMNRCRLRSKYLKWPSRKTFLEYKKAKTICNSLNKSTKKAYFADISRKGFVSNKTFSNTVKPFLTNKGFPANENIAIKCNEEIISDTTKLAGIFNTHYINIVQKSSGTTPNIKGNPENPLEDSITVKNLFNEYENHPSIINIKNQNLAKRFYETDFATTNQINKIIKEVDPKIATGPDKIPPKIIKLSANVIDSHLTNIINSDIEKKSFSECSIIASVRPIFKKNEREKVENYGPVISLNCFSKIYEKYILKHFKTFLNDFLFQYI